MTPTASFGSSLGKTVTRFAVAILGLLLLKAILGALPMLQNAGFIGSTLMTPMVLTNTVMNTLILICIFGLGSAIAADLRRSYPKSPHMAQAVMLIFLLAILVIAYDVYELPVACIITPATSVNIPAGTTPAQLAAFLEPYMLQNHSLYGYTFLILAAIPVIGLVLIGWRNLESMSDLLFRKAASAGTAQQPTPAPAPAAPQYAAPPYAPPQPAAAAASATMAAAAGAGAVRDLSSDDMDRLIRLKTLLDQHAITQADYDAQKGAILHGSAAPQESPEEQRLRQLLDAGALTPEEYAAQRKRLQR